MSFSDSLSTSFVTPAGQVYSGTLTLTGNTEHNLDLVCNAGPNVLTNALCNIVKSDIQALFLFCDQSITLYTNSSGAPQDSLAINANVPYSWTVNLAPVFSCPFSNNITAVFVNNTVNVSCTFKLRSVENN